MKSLPRRRKSLLAAVCVALGLGLAYGDGHAHGSIGYVTSNIVVAPSILVRVQGKEIKLANLLAGRVTAMQFMFTSCSSICPVQGATFSELQQFIGDGAADRAQLLSVSIDALGDDEPALKSWLRKFSAGPRWRVGALTPASVTPLYNLLEEQADPAYRHSSRVYLFDATGRLVWRTGEFPRAQDIGKLLERFAKGTDLAAGGGSR